MSRRWKLTILGLLVTAWGLLWVGQGLDLFGQDGGMNGEENWSVIGAIVAVIGIGVIVFANRTRVSK